MLQSIDVQEAEKLRWLTALDFLWLEVTRKCNLQCAHCYAGSDPTLPITGAMEYEDWRRILEQGFSLGCKTVQFIGGEPILYPHLLQLVADAKSIGYGFVEVFTNGTLLSDSVLQILRQSGVKLAFSLYAHSAQVHEGITRCKGSFRKTLKGMHRALHYDFPVRVGIIAMDANVDELEETKNLLRKIGVTSIGIDRVRGIGRGSELVPNKDPFSELCGSCWKGKLCIDPDGNAFPCVFSVFYPLGNAKQGIGFILESKRLQTFRRRVRDQEISLTGCNPDTCYPQTKPCGPDCAPSCAPCVPDIRW